MKIHYKCATLDKIGLNLGSMVGEVIMDHVSQTLDIEPDLARKINLYR